MTTTPFRGAVTVTHADNNGTWLVELRGEHDLSTAPQLDEQTRDVWPRCRLAVIDLSSAAFIDSTVVSWLLSAHNAITTAGSGTLVIIEGTADSMPARVLRMLRMREMLACYPTRQDAETHHPDVPSRAAG
jgi:anti-anti-sigma factor